MWNHSRSLLLPLFTLFIASYSPTLTLAQTQTPTCPIAPFAIPLRNCTFSSGTTSWGTLLELGSPPQRLCLVPSTVVNSTLVSQRSLCIKSNTPASNQCESLRGGFFNENSSTTWVTGDISTNGKAYNDSRSNPTWDHFNAPGFTKVGWDILHFPGGSNEVSLYGSGIALNQYGNNSNAGQLGLGKSSVFLSDAVAQKKSPSMSWSLDAGSQSVVKPRNGELVIGGYNKGKLDGSFRWGNLSDMSGDRPCPLRTVIKEMSIILPNGTSYPLKSSAEDITACIEPYDNLFRFTPGMLLNWKQITAFDETLGNIYSKTTVQGVGGGNTGNNILSFTELGLPYRAESAQAWSLSITLDNGYSTTLPHYEMQRPLTGWDTAGERQEVQGVTNVAILNAPTGFGEVPVLGKIFLSRSYLAVDYPSNRFGLAEVITDPLASASQLVALSCNNNNNNNNTLPNTPSQKPASFPLAGIIGVVLGGILFLILAAVAVYFFRKRARRNRAVEAPVYEIGTAHRNEMGSVEHEEVMRGHYEMGGGGGEGRGGSGDGVWRYGRRGEVKGLRVEEGRGDRQQQTYYHP